MEDNTNYRRLIGERLKKIELESMSSDNMEIEYYRELYALKEMELKKAKRKRRFRIIMILLLSAVACGGLVVCANGSMPDVDDSEELRCTYCNEKAACENRFRKKLKICGNTAGKCKLIL